jgi:hypothetical protein
MREWTLQIDPGNTTDGEGWSYAVEPSLNYHPKKGLEHFVRRRLWMREKTTRATASNTRGGAGGGADSRKSYTIFFERIELLKKDLRAEENDDELVSMFSATW